MVTMESLSRNRHRVVDRSSMQSGLVILFYLTSYGSTTCSTWTKATMSSHTDVV